MDTVSETISPRTSWVDTHTSQLITIVIISLLLIIVGFIQTLYQNSVSSQKLSQMQVYKELEEKANASNLPNFKIKQLVLYPIQGLQGISVKKLHLVEGGALLDRNWTIVQKQLDKKTKYKILFNGNCVQLSQIQLNAIYDNTHFSKHTNQSEFQMPTCIQLSIKDTEYCPHIKERSILIDVSPNYMITNPKFSEQGHRGVRTELLEGYMESNKTNEWLSQVLGADVFVLRAANDYLRPVRDVHFANGATKSDQKRAFLSEVALHMVNLSSIRQLKDSMLDKYCVTREKAQSIDLNIEFDALLFRPNIVIDSGDADETSSDETSSTNVSKQVKQFEPFCEDEIQSAKLKDGLYIRQVGPCFRCKTTSMNWQKRVRDPNLEPYKTMQETRNIPSKGTAFGVYFQIDICSDKQVHEICLDDDISTLHMERTFFPKNLPNLKD